MFADHVQLTPSHPVLAVQVHPAPGPEEVNWQSLWFTHSQRVRRAFIVTPFIVVLVVSATDVHAAGQRKCRPHLSNQPRNRAHCLPALAGPARLSAHVGDVPIERHLLLPQQHSPVSVGRARDVLVAGLGRHALALADSLCLLRQALGGVLLEPAQVLPGAALRPDRLFAGAVDPALAGAAR